MNDSQLDEETREHLRNLIARLDSPRASDRWGAADTLGAMGPKKAQAALPHLRDIRQDPDDYVRVTVAQAITQLDPTDQAAFLDLLAFLEHPRAGIRVSSAEGLAELAPGAKQTIPALRKALHDPVADVRGKAALALAAFGPASAEAIPDLIRLLDDPAEDARMTATLALRNMGPAALPALPDLLRVAKVWNVADRSAIPGTLMAIAPGHPEVIAFLGEALGSDDFDPDSDDYELYGEAAKGLAACGPAARGALPALLKAVRCREYDAGPWSYILQALANIGPEAREAIPVLEKALMHEDSYFRERATETIEKIRGRPV